MLSVSACTATAPLNEYSGAIPDGITATEFKQAVRDAGNKRDWIIKDVGNNAMEATYVARGHSIQVKITYDKDSYDITYLSSTGMKYNQTDGTIHRNYNRWVNNLRHDIEVGLMRAEAR